MIIISILPNIKLINKIEETDNTFLKNFKVKRFKNNLRCLNQLN